MDQSKTGALIRALRRERGMTQRELAQLLGVTGKAVSKWERGLGCPDVSLLEPLSDILGVGTETLLAGELPCRSQTGGNMKKSHYYVCPLCGNLVLSAAEAEISCCGRKLAALTPKKAAEGERLRLERVEDEWFITADHPMTKEHYISFVAFATGESVHLIKQYPEWDLQLRFPARRRGMLLWYCTEHGLFYQLI